MMKSAWLKSSVGVAALTVAFASGTGVALAGTTSGDGSILGGNQVSVPISVPVNVCGNAIAILGEAFGMCEGGASVSGGSGHGSSTTSGNGSIGGGNQISVPISVPVNVCGNSASVLGTAVSGCKGGSTVGTPPHGTPPPCKHHHKTPPPCKHHHKTPPPCKHHHKTPPPRHHHGGTPGHHGGTGTTVTTTSLTSTSLPTTGANFVGLLALAGGVILAGAGSVLFAARRRVLRAVTRRVLPRTLCPSRGRGPGRAKHCPGETVRRRLSGGDCLRAARGSAGPDLADDGTPQGGLPAAVGVEPEPGQFPLAVLGMVGQYSPRGVAGGAAGKVDLKVGVLGHRLHCARRGERFGPSPATVHGEWEHRCPDGKLPDMTEDNGLAPWW